MTRERRRFTAGQKASIVRRHLAGKVAVSDLAAEFNVQPSQIHLWVKQVVDQAEKAFERGEKRRGESLANEELAGLRAKLAAKNELILGLTEMLVRNGSA